MELLLSDIFQYRAATRSYLKAISNASSPYGWHIIKRHAMEGRIKILDALYLTSLLRRTRPASILEIGSFLGFSAYWILKTSNRWDAKVLAIDPNIRHRVFDNPRSIVEQLNMEFDKRITIHTAFLGSYGEGVYYDYDHYEPNIPRDEVDSILVKIPSLNQLTERYDLIFIDGDHSYQATMENFRICLSSLNPGGTIIFHDAITWPDVGRVLADLKFEFGASATIKILGKHIPKFCDGLGVFKLN